MDHVSLNTLLIWNVMAKFNTKYTFVDHISSHRTSEKEICSKEQHCGRNSNTHPCDFLAPEVFFLAVSFWMVIVSTENLTPSWLPAVIHDVSLCPSSFYFTFFTVPTRRWLMLAFLPLSECTLKFHLRFELYIKPKTSTEISRERRH